MLTRLVKQITVLMNFPLLQVHIGNNVYILEKAWNENIAPATLKISIAIKNLVGAMWSVREGANLSVTGGKSPKTHEAVKEAAPEGMIEAIYGKFETCKLYLGHFNLYQIMLVTTDVTLLLYSRRLQSQNDVGRGVK